MSAVDALPPRSELIRTGIAAPPLRLRREVGRRPLDFVSGAGGGVKLVSGRLIDLLRGGGFTGWETYEIEVDVHGLTQPMAGHKGWVVTGRCGPILLDRARIEMLPTMVPEKFHQAKVGLYFDPESWDGSDLFMSTDHTGHVLVTERVRDAIVGAGMRNLAFESVDQYVFVR